MKSHKFNIFLIGVTILALSALISTYSHGETEKKREFTIGFAAMNVEMTWMKFAYHAMRKKAAELDVELITYDASNNVAKQAINIEELIRRGVDAIITDPVNVEGLTQALELASKKEIPVVAFDRSAIGAPYLFWLLTRICGLI
jgi:ribose transport system substrate-binding protein